jgi:hypothetical protein
MCREEITCQEQMQPEKQQKGIMQMHLRDQYLPHLIFQQVISKAEYAIYEGQRHSKSSVKTN